VIKDSKMISSVIFYAQSDVPASGNAQVFAGDNGWIWLGVFTATLGILIWNFTESILGKYVRN